jgi:hypothetical protein
MLKDYVRNKLYLGPLEANGVSPSWITICKREGIASKNNLKFIQTPRPSYVPKSVPYNLENKYTTI